MSENTQTTQAEIQDEPILTAPETVKPEDNGGGNDPDPYCCSPGGGGTGPDGGP